jgi:flagellar FliL protein
MPDVVKAEAPAQAGKGAADAAPAKPKSPLLMMIVASVVMIGAAYGVAAFVLKPMFNPSATAAVEGKGSHGSDEHGQGEIINFENIIVNPSGTMGSRYLNATVGIEVGDAATRAAIEGNSPRIKDALITILSSQTIDQLSTATNREEIRKSIQARLNHMIAPNEVKAVYFLDFVLQ